MSDAFKDFVARREAAIKNQKTPTDWLWILVVLAAVAALLYVVLRPDPATAAVNPNTADAAALATLPGVGPDMADKIISRRAEKPFGKADDLLDVPGIGPKTLEKMKSRLKFEQ